MEGAIQSTTGMKAKSTRIVAITATLLLVAAMVGPASVAAQSSTLAVDVDQHRDTGEVVVTVTENETGVENATVSVNAAGNYSTNDSYSTGPNGTVTLPEPSETVDVEFVVQSDNSTVTENATLVPRNESLSLDVAQSAGEPATVTVTQYGDPVENATVSAISDADDPANATYNESVVTDANGTASLPAPEENVTVTVTATWEDLTAETQSTLVATLEGFEVWATQESDGGVAIEVTDNGVFVDTATVVVEGDYAYTGEYTAENGTVSLPAPAANGSATITATRANDTATTTIDLVAPTDDNPNNDFAESLVAFIGFITGQDLDGPIGQHISDFAREHNPGQGNGPPAHVTDNAASPGQGNGNGGPSVAENRTPPGQANGTPGDATGAEAGETHRGPPDHAGNGNDRRGGPGQSQGQGPPNVAGQ